MGVVTLPSDLNQDSIQKILQDFYNDQDLKVTQVSGQETFLGENDNFASDIKRWTVTVTQNGVERPISFVVKTSTEGSFHKRISALWRPFAKEIFWFKQAHPTLTRLCPEMKSISPICFYGYSTYEGRMFRPKSFIDRTMLVMFKMFTMKCEVGIILLENLKFGDRPMKMLDKTKIMTPDQVKVVLQTLARLHGSFLKWRESTSSSSTSTSTSTSKETSAVGIRPQDIKALTILTAPWVMKSSVEKAQASVSKLLRNQGKDEELIGRWEKYAKEKMLQKLVGYLSTKPEMEKSKIVTLCHGDTWTNNMMFSEDESQVTLLDYQLMALLHPAKDLWYFLSVATDADFRRDHLGHLLKSYFEVFSSYLKDANISMTFEKFEEEVLERRDILISSTCDLMPAVLCPDKLELTTWSSWKEMENKRESIIGGDPKPVDNPLVVEIRRRLTTMVEEAAALNFI